MDAANISDDYKAVDHRRSPPKTPGAISSPVSLLFTPSPFLDSSHEHSVLSPPGAEDRDSEKTRKLKKNQGRKVNNFAYRVRDHVKMGPKWSETVKGKINLGAKIIQKGGRENTKRILVLAGGSFSDLKTESKVVNNGARMKGLVIRIPSPHSKVIFVKFCRSYRDLK